MKILVIGDIMLDEYVEGVVERISPEAPVPVFRRTGVKKALGGAGNVAMNLKALGAEVCLLGAFDPYGDIADLLSKSGIEYDRSNVFDNPSTDDTIKTRYMVGDHQLLRVDHDAHHNGDLLVDSLKKAIVSCDAIIVSDYNKGVVTELLMEVLEECRDKKAIFVDPKPANIWLYPCGCYMLPNLKEFNEIGRRNYTRNQAGWLVTEGAGGMTTYDDEDYGDQSHVPALGKAISVAGAGDTATAAFAYACTAGISDALLFASQACAVVVEKPGTATANLEEIHARFQ